MTRPTCLPFLRELARCYQGFERASGRNIRELGLTPAQFDIIATLGNTSGMNCKELGERTLITKGTLTGVLDRLFDKGLIDRHIPPEDRRSLFISLTAAGQTLFESVFPAHMAFLQYMFQDFDATLLEQLRNQLEPLRHRFEQESSQ